jgi:hypothetical protein
LLMSPRLTQEAYVDTLRDLVKVVGRAFRIRVRSLGGALWERPEADAGQALRCLRLERRCGIPSTASIALPMLEAAKVLPLVARVAPLDDLDRSNLFDASIRGELRPTRRQRAGH